MIGRTHYSDMDAVLKPMCNDSNVSAQRGPRVVSSTGARNLERGRGSLSLSTADVGVEKRAGAGVSFVVEFPGGPSCPPPRPPRLVGATAEAAAQRNVGTMATVLNTDANRDYQSERPQPKLRSTEAKGVAARYTGESTAFCLNHDRNRGYTSARGPCARGVVGREERLRSMARDRGVVGSVLSADDNVDYASPRPASRLMGAAAEMNAQRHSGAAARRAMDVDGNTGYQSARPAPRDITVEARDNASRGHGQAVSQLMSNDSVTTAPPQQPRVKPEARDVAMRNRGTCGLALEGRLTSDPVHDVRVKGSGKHNYQRGQQGSMHHVLSGDEHLPAFERPASRVRDTGNEILQNGQTGTVHRLFHSYGQLPQSARPAARVRPDARQNAIRNMGTMSDFL